MKDKSREIANLEGWGELSFNNLIKAMNDKRRISLSKFIYAIGIRFVGEKNAKAISLVFKNTRQFKDMIAVKGKLSNEYVIRLRKQADYVFLDGMKAADPDIPNWKINTCYYSVRTLGKLGIRKSPSALVGKQ